MTENNANTRPENEPDDDPFARLEAILAEHREPDQTEAEEDATNQTASGLVPPWGIGDGHVPDGGQAAATDAGEAEAEADAGESLPDAPLFALLRSIEAEIGPERIDRIWVFPPRRLQAGETSVVVVAAYPETQEDRRRVYAAHYTAHEEAKQPRLALDEYGTAPTQRVGRLVEEVVERLKEEPAAAPRSHPIDGNASHWHTVLHEIAETFLEEARRNPRLRP